MSRTRTLPTAVWPKSSVWPGGSLPVFDVALEFEVQSFPELVGMQLRVLRRHETHG